MISKIKVIGKTQNGAALGVMKAYVEMNPNTTLADLRKAFPNDIAPDKGVAELFLPLADAEACNTNMSLYFTKDGRPITLQDGSVIAMSQIWTGKSLQNLINVAAKYNIDVEVNKEANEDFGKLGYVLKYTYAEEPKVAAPVEKKSKTWLWIVIAAVVIIAVLVALLLMKGNKTPEVQVVEKTVIVHDTLYVQKIEEIEKDFNAVEFELGKAELPEAAKFVLHDLAKVMEKNPELRLRLEGHTSAEGDADLNQSLSQARAQAAVDFLVNNEGIDINRLEAVGLGSTQLKNTENPNAPENRRTEFIIIEQ
jgi:outer membrane protein OmpA-like peptidoglycan-associated protein